MRKLQLFVFLTLCTVINGGVVGAQDLVSEKGIEREQATPVLAFTLPAWKTIHFNDDDKAVEHVTIAKKLGCTVQQREHAGHTDVTYRCSDWKVLTVEDAKDLETWVKWLTSAGFDVSKTQVDPVFAKGPEKVQLRLVAWKRIHGDGSAQEAEMVANMKKMGVEVVVENHGNHNDIRFRAPTWREIYVADPAAAQQWTGWLKQMGFEARN